MFFPTSRFELGRKTAQRRALLIVLAMFLTLTTARAALAASSFTPQTRVGYHTGDQWEPAMAADGYGHVYILYPQYGAVPDCASCTAPSIALLVSSDNGLTWQALKAPLPFSSGQFDPQIMGASS